MSDTPSWIGAKVGPLTREAFAAAVEDWLHQPPPDPYRPINFFIRCDACRSMRLCYVIGPVPWDQDGRLECPSCKARVGKIDGSSWWPP